jgi:hypothetical protein
MILVIGVVMRGVAGPWGSPPTSRLVDWGVVVVKVSNAVSNPDSNVGVLFVSPTNGNKDCNVVVASNHISNMGSNVRGCWALWPAAHQP